jgi:hypothetical protein
VVVVVDCSSYVLPLFRLELPVMDRQCLKISGCMVRPVVFRKTFVHQRVWRLDRRDEAANCTRLSEFASCT